ncbi:MAG: hypothetical protein M3Q14_03250 [bacterium]|nr:hypothetical protein [bacterium]
MNLENVSQDGRISKVLDVVAVLIIGAVLGIAISQVFTTYETQTLQPTETIRRLPATELKSDEGTVEAPMYPEGPKIEES